MSRIIKAPGASTNTFVTVVEALSVNSSTMKAQQVKADVLFTSDEGGETLSIVDPTTNKQIVVAWECVEPLIEHTRKARIRQ